MMLIRLGRRVDAAERARMVKQKGVLPLSGLEPLMVLLKMRWRLSCQLSFGLSAW